MNKYDPKSIEPKWQKFWEDNQTFRVETDLSKEKFFGLVEFPYPSGVGLHVGHPRPFTAMDVITRQKRMEGKNVLYPIGFDSFGLPTENFAIKTGRPPAEITDENIANFTRQLKALGFGFDWSRAVTTSEPEYYKWTQWIFLQLYKHGLAYKANQPINWCPKDKIGLANEEVVDGCCERCGNPVEKRNKEQWMLAITKYADKLLAGLNEVDYITRAKIQQENWIGRSEGAEINFPIKNSEEKITVFTTRPDTIFGVTFLAVSAEWAEKWFADKEAVKEIKEYIAATLQGRTTAVAREEVEKTGIDSGIVAVNPVSGDEVPVWIVNYVLADVGTGAIMAVPAHDERDFEFAQKFNLPVKQVVAPYFILSGKDAVQEGVETLDRKVVDAIIENQTGEFLLLKEQANGIDHYHFVGGGTDGEDEYIALAREIREETGYTDYVISKKVSGEVISSAFRQTKNKNQKTTGPFYHVKLQGDSQVASEVDEGKHSLVWVKKNKVKDLITWPHHVYGWECFLGQKEIFTDEGRVINSAQFDGLNSIEARKKIIAFLEEEGIGNRKVQFKLRDWVFSRQRYWGEPIPLVFCENCAKNDNQNGQIVELKKVSAWNRLVNGTKTAKGFAFGNKQTPVEFKIGDTLTFVHDDETRSAEVTKVHQFKSLAELTKATELHGKLFDTAVPLTEVELTKLYSEYNPKYPEYIVETGLTVCEFTLQPPKYKGNSGWIPLPASELPLELPKVEKYLPTDTGESPIAAMTDWVKTTCPQCGGPARRETDTMPNWAGSSWYFLRYTDPTNNSELASQENLKYWTPVDWYNGGMEHTVLHLLYSRFWNQFLYDIGVVPTLEPYKKRTSHGMILAKGGEKMSKSKGNVVNPDEMVELYGADALRTYIMFMGPFDQPVEWDTNGLVGVRRFLDRVWNLQNKINDEEVKYTIKINGIDSPLPSIKPILHQTIKKVSDDISNMRFNTAVAHLMVLTNEMSHPTVRISSSDYQVLIKLLSPFAPHIGEELWSLFGNGGSISHAEWPKFEAVLAKDSEVTVAVQVNGKVRAELIVSPEIAEEEMKALALANENIQKWLEGKEPKKVIYVKGRLVSIVV